MKKYRNSYSHCNFKKQFSLTLFPKSTVCIFRYCSCAFLQWRRRASYEPRIFLFQQGLHACNYVSTAKAKQTFKVITQIITGKTSPLCFHSSGVLASNQMREAGHPKMDIYLFCFFFSEILNCCSFFHFPITFCKNGRLGFIVMGGRSNRAVFVFSQPGFHALVCSLGLLLKFFESRIWGLASVCHIILVFVLKYLK